MAASTSSSGDVKIWVQQAAGKKGKAAHWRCQSVGTRSGTGYRVQHVLLLMDALHAFVWYNMPRSVVGKKRNSFGTLDF